MQREAQLREQQRQAALRAELERKAQVDAAQREKQRQAALRAEQERQQREAQLRDQQRLAALQAEQERQQREANERARTRAAEADRAAAADRERQRQQAEARQRREEADRRQAEADRREEQRVAEAERRQREQRQADASRARDRVASKSSDDNSLLPPEPETGAKSAAAARREPARRSNDNSLLPPEPEPTGALGRAAGAATGAAAIAGLASRGDGTGRTIWMHNNSQMALTGAGDRVQLVYDKPRSGLGDIGINSGTTLFTGSRKGGTWSGEAITFSRRCGQTKFDVSGTESSDGRKVELRGRKPNLDGSCNVTGHRDEVLVFERFETVVR